MSESLILEMLRAIRADLGDVKADMRDVKQRMTALEIQTSALAATEGSHYASLALRLDAMDGRLERLERRAGLSDAPA